MFQIWSWKIDTMQFCLGVIPQTATGYHPNPFNLCTFLSQMYAFLSQYYSYHKIHQIWNPETQTFPIMCFVKIIKRFDSIRP